jgi:hypothetical protein
MRCRFNATNAKKNDPGRARRRLWGNFAGEPEIALINEADTTGRHAVQRDPIIVIDGEPLPNRTRKMRTERECYEVVSGNVYDGIAVIYTGKNVLLRPILYRE